MMKIQPMNRKETRALLEQINQEYTCDAKTLLIDDYTFFISDKNKVYIMNNDIKNVDISKVRVNSFGLYLCEINRGKVRLSIEGTQLLGRYSTKNIIELSVEDSKLWMMGNDLPTNQSFDGFVIIKHGSDYMGCGKIKEGIILNFVSKQRRIKE
ncbi:hypothetical protein H6503_00385 [Candidatus Woesearchaeota archaeon]|nr:hypothetical protein [Candidatus Woesearchaeota archaeon]